MRVSNCRAINCLNYIELPEKSWREKTSEGLAIMACAAVVKWHCSRNWAMSSKICTEPGSRGRWEMRMRSVLKCRLICYQQRGVTAQHCERANGTSARVSMWRSEKTTVSFVIGFDITEVSMPFSAHGIDIAGRLYCAMRSNGNSWIDPGWRLLW